MRLCPAPLEPDFRPRPWGSHSLAPHFPNMSHLAEPIGEAWMTGNGCRFASGPFAGLSLGEVWPEIPPEWRGTEIAGGRDFPLLVKFIFPQDKLSVQVHPDDAYAARYEQEQGGRGKTEMWYTVEARPGAEVFAGLKPNVTREDFRSAIAQGTAESCLQPVRLETGDGVFVPAGMAHTIGPGLVLCEVQQNSDLTYRVYDYNRRDARGQARPLHIEKALEVMRFGEQTGGKVRPATIRRDRVRETYYAVCPYFATERWIFSDALEASTSTARFELLIFLAGQGEILWAADRAAYAPAEVWLMPAALGKFRLAPRVETSLLRTYVPGDLEKLKHSWIDRGLSEAEWTALVHR
jgi:mannose-6-phosphate isomerase